MPIKKKTTLTYLQPVESSHLIPLKQTYQPQKASHFLGVNISSNPQVALFHHQAPNAPFFHFLWWPGNSKVSCGWHAANLCVLPQAPKTSWVVWFLRRHGPSEFSQWVFHAFWGKDVWVFTSFKWWTKAPFCQIYVDQPILSINNN